MANKMCKDWLMHKTQPKMSIMLNKNAVNTSTDPRYTGPKVNAINTSTDSRFSAPKVSRNDSPRNNGVSNWRSHANQAGSFDKKAYDRQWYRDHKADYQEGGKYWHKYGEWKDKVKAAVKGAVNKLSKLGESVYDKTHSDQLAKLSAGSDMVREHNKRRGKSGVMFEDLRYKNLNGVGRYATTETAKRSRHNDKVSSDMMRRRKKNSPWKG